MNRWPGSKADSAEQASQRNSRAARRFINTIPTINSDSDELDFEDCNSSLTNPLLNVDGNDEPDLGGEGTMTDAAARRAA